VLQSHPSRASIYFAGALLIIQCCWFLYQVYWGGGYYLSDSYEYLWQATNLQHGSLYCADPSEPFNADFLTKRPPLYGIWLALLHLFSTNPIWTALSQQVLCFASILLYRHAAYQIGYRTRLDKWFLIWLLLSPAQFIYTNLIMSEILLQFFLALVFYSAVRLLHTPHHRYTWLYAHQIALIAALFVKPVLYPFAVLVTPFVFLVGYHYKLARKQIVLAAALPILSIVGYSYANYTHTGVFHFSSIQSINAVHYNTYYFNTNTYGKTYADSILNNTAQLVNAQKDYPDKIAIRRAHAQIPIHQQPISYLLFHTKGTIRFFLDPGRFDLATFFNIPSNGFDGFLQHSTQYGFWTACQQVLHTSSGLFLAVIILLVLANFLKLCLFLYASLRGLPQYTYLYAYTIALVGYVALATGPLGASRFYMPLIPLICVCTLTRLLKKNDIVTSF
jgi:hypothetical protein